MSYTDRLQRLNLPTLKYRRLRGDMIEVFKITLGILGGTGTYSVPLRASTPSRDWGFQAPEIMGAKEDVVYMCQK